MFPLRASSKLTTLLFISNLSVLFFIKIILEISNNQKKIINELARKDDKDVFFLNRYLRNIFDTSKYEKVLSNLPKLILESFIDRIVTQQAIKFQHLKKGDQNMIYDNINNIAMLNAYARTSSFILYCTEKNISGIPILFIFRDDKTIGIQSTFYDSENLTDIQKSVIKKIFSILDISNFYSETDFQINSLTKAF